MEAEAVGEPLVLEHGHLEAVALEARVVVGVDGAAHALEYDEIDAARLHQLGEVDVDARQVETRTRRAVLDDEQALVVVAVAAKRALHEPAHGAHLAHEQHELGARDVVDGRLAVGAQYDLGLLAALEQLDHERQHAEYDVEAAVVHEDAYALVGV